MPSNTRVNNTHTHETQTQARRPLRAHAFSLIEILVVISIIGVLIGLILAGVSAITGNAKEMSTNASFTTLEAATDSYKELTGRWPSGATISSSPIYTDNGQRTAWTADFFEELGKFGDISSTLGPLLASQPDDLGPDDIRTYSPVADGWGIGIVPIVPKDIASQSSLIYDYRPWFYSSGADGAPISEDPKSNTDFGGIATGIIDELNSNNPTADNFDDYNLNNALNKPTEGTGLPADDMYSDSAP